MVQDLQIIPIGSGAFRLTWSSDQVDPVYRVYRDGLLIATTRLGIWVTPAVPDEFPTFEVLDHAEGDPQQAYPARLTLAWYSDPAVASYQVQQYVDAVWTTRATIANTAGR